MHSAIIIIITESERVRVRTVCPLTGWVDLISLEIKRQAA